MRISAANALDIQRQQSTVNTDKLVSSLCPMFECGYMPGCVAIYEPFTSSKR